MNAGFTGCFWLSKIFSHHTFSTLKCSDLNLTSRPNLITPDHTTFHISSKLATLQMWIRCDCGALPPWLPFPSAQSVQASHMATASTAIYHLACRATCIQLYLIYEM